MAAYAQQDILYTQYLVSALGYNPAYTGSREALSSMFLYRYQWVNIDGAPRTFTLNLHSPLGDRNLSLGLAINYDKVGVVTRTDITGSVAYKINLDRSKLNFGLGIGGRNFNAKWTDVTANAPNGSIDPSFSQDYNKWVPNFSAGIYWWNSRFSLGFSIPMLTTYKLSSEATGSSESVTERHYYLSGSYLFDMNETWQFKPSALVKLTSRAPAQLDLTASFIYDNKLRLGGTLRNLENVSAIIQYFTANNWNFGYSYDYYFNDLRNYNAGSHEIFIGIDLPVGRSLVQSPRYF